MKRFLSIILALALVISMIPATFATEGESAAIVDTELEYVFSREAVGKASEKTAAFGDATYETIVTDLSDKYSYVGARSLASGALRANVANYAVRIGNIGDANNGLVFKLNVPNPGVYIPSFVFCPWVSGAQATLYLVKDTDAEAKNWNMADGGGSGGIVAAIGNAEQENNVSIKLGTTETYLETGDTKTSDTDEFERIKLDSGGYYLVIYLSGVHKDATQLAATTKPYNEIWFKSFKLQRLPTVSVTCNDTAIEIGKQTTVAASALDATDVETTAEYTYSSSSDAIATVDADGVVTGVSGGTATITATATIDGYEVSGSVDVVVIPEDMGNDGVTLEYIFKTSVLTEETIAAAQAGSGWDDRGLLMNLAFVNDYSALNGTTAPWAFGNFVGYSYHMQNNVLMTMNKSNYGDETRNPFFALKLKVSNKGWYKLAVDLNKADFGTAANVYILPVGDIETIDRTHIANEKAIGTFDVTLGSSDVGKVYIPKRGDYYIFMDFNTQNPTTYNNEGKHYLYLNKIILSATDAPTPDAVDSGISFAATANIDADITVEGFDYNGAVDEVPTGTEIKVTAPEKVGDYEFKYWKTGFDNSKNYVSNSNVYEFTALTNIFLTAVYDKADIASDDEVKVEFYNGNKQFISETAIAKGTAFSTIKPANASMTGLIFKGWGTVAGDLTDTSTFDENTRVVAQYEETGNAISGTIYADYAERAENTYGAEIELENANAKYWMRNGKIVGYGTKYTHFAWAGTKITSSVASIEKNPIVVLETTPVDGAYMIEYDKGNKTIAEVGILFGSSAKITIDSCNSKATSQWNKAHGQFAATPYGDVSESYARGYMIYGSAGNYKVIYTDAVEIQ